MSQIEMQIAAIDVLRRIETEKRTRLAHEEKGKIHKQLREEINALVKARKALGDPSPKPVSMRYRWRAKTQTHSVRPERTIFDVLANWAKKRHTQTVILPSGRKVTTPRGE